MRCGFCGHLVSVHDLDHGSGPCWSPGCTCVCFLAMPDVVEGQGTIELAAAPGLGVRVTIALRGESVSVELRRERALWLITALYDLLYQARRD